MSQCILFAKLSHGASALACMLECWDSIDEGTPDNVGNYEVGPEQAIENLQLAVRLVGELQEVLVGAPQSDVARNLFDLLALCEIHLGDVVYARFLLESGDGEGATEACRDQMRRASTACVERLYDASAQLMTSCRLGLNGEPPRAPSMVPEAGDLGKCMHPDKRPAWCRDHAWLDVKEHTTMSYTDIAKGEPKNNFPAHPY